MKVNMIAKLLAIWAKTNQKSLYDETLGGQG
jgi:hypothetical protein